MPTSHGKNQKGFIMNKVANKITENEALEILGTEPTDFYTYYLFEVPERPLYVIRKEVGLFLVPTSRVNQFLE